MENTLLIRRFTMASAVGDALSLTDYTEGHAASASGSGHEQILAGREDRDSADFR
jgi:hypothetical protein